MATAVQPSSEPKTPNPRAKLVLASLFGAVLIIAGLAVAMIAVPYAIQQVLPAAAAGQADPMRVVREGVLRLVQLAAIAGFVVLGALLAGSTHLKGLRGGIFLAAVALIATFFVVRYVGLALEESSVGLPITLVTLGVLLGLTYYGLISPRAEKWMHAIDEQGWFHFFNYKPSQGKRLRRWTMIGILAIGGTGVWTIRPDTGHLPFEDWRLSIPFTGTSLTILPSIALTVPVLVAVLTLWVAWRAVNMPVFADFLVATDAEMKKVSWSSRKRLFQDTIVVLATLFLLTVFLFSVDWFWGTVLSWKPIGVLPSASEKAPSFNATEGRKVDW